MREQGKIFAQEEAEKKKQKQKEEQRKKKAEEEKKKLAEEEKKKQQVFASTVTLKIISEILRYSESCHSWRCIRVIWRWLFWHREFEEVKRGSKASWSSA